MERRRLTARVGSPAVVPGPRSVVSRDVVRTGRLLHRHSLPLCPFRPCGQGAWHQAAKAPCERDQAAESEEAPVGDKTHDQHDGTDVECRQRQQCQQPRVGGVNLADTARCQRDGGQHIYGERNKRCGRQRQRRSKADRHEPQHQRIAQPDDKTLRNHKDCRWGLAKKCPQAVDKVRYKVDNQLPIAVLPQPAQPMENWWRQDEHCPKHEQEPDADQVACQQPAGELVAHEQKTKGSTQDQDG